MGVVLSHHLLSGAEQYYKGNSSIFSECQSPAYLGATPLSHSGPHRLGLFSECTHSSNSLHLPLNILPEPCLPLHHQPLCVFGGPSIFTGSATLYRVD